MQNRMGKKINIALVFNEPNFLNRLKKKKNMEKNKKFKG